MAVMEQISIRIPEEELKILEEAAAKDRRTRASAIRKGVALYVRGILGISLPELPTNAENNLDTKEHTQGLDEQAKEPQSRLTETPKRGGEQ